MKDPVKRLKLTIAVAAALLLLYSVIMLFMERRQYHELIMKDTANKAEAVRGMVEGYGGTADEIGRGFLADENARVRLMAIGLRDQVTDGTFSGNRLTEDSMVVRVQDGTLELPAEAEGLFPDLLPDMITDEYQQARVEYHAASASGAARDQVTEVFLTSGRIAEEWYCVSWVPIEAYDDYIRSHLSEEHLPEILDTVDDIELFMVAAEPDGPAASGKDSGTLLHKTKGLSKYNSLEDLGITREDLKAETFTIQTGREDTYLCSPIRVENLGYTLVCCNSVKGEKAAFLGDVIDLILFAAIMLAGLITWCYSVQWLARREELTEEERQKYSPGTVKKRTTILTLMGALAVTLFAFTIVMVQYLFQENRIGSNMLDIFCVQLEDARNNTPGVYALETERYTELGKTVSSMLTEDPSLLKRESLSEIAEAVSAEYLILYDARGRETACSRQYTGFVLPEDPEDPFSDFRRLLKGIPVIIHPPEKDMITGEKRSFVGIRYDIPGEKESFGALLIALPSRDQLQAEENEGAVQLVKQKVYWRMQEGNRMIMEIDPETGTVVSCSKAAFNGADSAGLGIKAGELKDRHMGFYYVDDEWYFGVSGLSGDHIWYYLTDSTSMSRTGLFFALVSGLLLLIVLALTAGCGLKEYTEGNYERYAARMTEKSEAYLRRIEQRGPSLYSLARGWRNMRPEMKTKTIVQILTGILLGIMILATLLNSPLARHSVLSFVIRGNWTKGLNFPSVIAAVVIICLEYVAYLALKVIFSMLNSLTDRKGETVFRLVRSFCNYAIFIGAVCLALSYLGIDAVTLLASVGILSLAISLGAKDIVADILAGLSIVFEKTYNVGDIVQIGDFKGTVIEIGVRSTKLVNKTNDIKTISNHEISNIINYSKLTSIYKTRISVPVTVSVVEMKELFEKELPLVREINPYIISGPTFDGIEEFIDDKMIISFSVEGPEEHMGKIRRDLHQALQSMAERNLLRYARSDITINVEGGSVKDDSDDHKKRQRRRRASREKQDDNTDL